MKSKYAFLSLFLTVVLGMIACSDAAAKTAAGAQPSVDEAVNTAVDAYIYGYSLITTEVTRVQMSNVPKAEGLHAPMGQFANALRYPPGDLPGRIGT